MPDPLHANMRATSRGMISMPDNGAQKHSRSYLLGWLSGE
jgi:hypothetical protein